MAEQLGLPLIGSVAAGSPLLAVENQRGKIQIPPSLFSPRADYPPIVVNGPLSIEGLVVGLESRREGSSKRLDLNVKRKA